MTNTPDLTIIASPELNFLLYVHNMLDPKKRFPHNQLPNENAEKVRNKIRVQWDHFMDQLESKGYYIHYSESEIIYLEKLVENTAKQERENAAEQFRSWWYFQSDGGLQRLLEHSIATSRKLEDARGVFNLEKYPQLLITYDEVPNDFRTTVGGFAVFSQMKILGY